MNKRQKKKFIKKNMAKLRKIHPNEGDVVALQWNPDSGYIYILAQLLNYIKHGRMQGYLINA